MTLGAETVTRLAGSLDAAEKTRAQVGQFSLACPDMTIEDAYAVQRTWVAAKIAAGRRLIGHKIGLTSRAMQRSSNIDEPDYGALLDDMLFGAGQGQGLERGKTPRGGRCAAPGPARPGGSFHGDYGPLGSISGRFA